MENQLFRKKSLDKISSPEKLDEPLPSAGVTFWVIDFDKFHEKLDFPETIQKAAFKKVKSYANHGNKKFQLRLERINKTTSKTGSKTDLKTGLKTGPKTGPKTNSKMIKIEQTLAFLIDHANREREGHQRLFAILGTGLSHLVVVIAASQYCCGQQEGE